MPGILKKPRGLMPVASWTESLRQNRRHHLPRRRTRRAARCFFSKKGPISPGGRRQHNKEEKQPKTPVKGCGRGLGGVVCSFRHRDGCGRSLKPFRSRLSSVLTRGAAARQSTAGVTRQTTLNAKRRGGAEG